MRAETLLYSLGAVGDDLLGASEQPVRAEKSRIVRIAALAATLAVIVGLGWIAVRMLAGRTEIVGTSSETVASEPTAAPVTEDRRPLSELAVGPLDGGEDGIGPAVPLIYEDEHRIMFYLERGVFCYDLDASELLFTVDFQKALGTIGGVQGTDPGGVAEVSADGETVLMYLWNEDPAVRGSAVRIDVPSQSFVYCDFEPLTEPFDRSRIEGSMDWNAPAVLRNLRYTRGGKVWAPFAEVTALPQLAARQSFGGADFLYSREEVQAELDANLWTAGLAELLPPFGTMPVFEDSYFMTESIGVLDVYQMMELCDRVFHALGYEDFHVEIHPGADGDPTPETLTQHADELTVEITDAGLVTVTFLQPLPLPADGSLDYGYDPDDPRQVLYRWGAELQTLLQIPWQEDWELSALSIQAANDPRYRSGRSTCEEKERYLANELSGLSLALTEDGALAGFRFRAFDAFGNRWLPLGDYPIITAEAAAVHVRQNEYFQIMLYGGSNRWTWQDDDLSLVELVYPSEGAYRLRMPYYRFWRLGTNPDYNGGEPVYVPLYVPAIERAYLTDFPAAVYETDTVN